MYRSSQIHELMFQFSRIHEQMFQFSRIHERYLLFSRITNDILINEFTNDFFHFHEFTNEKKPIPACTNAAGGGLLVRKKTAKKQMVKCYEWSCCFRSSEYVVNHLNIHLPLSLASLWHTCLIYWSVLSRKITQNWLLEKSTGYAQPPMFHFSYLPSLLPFFLWAF